MYKHLYEKIIDLYGNVDEDSNSKGARPVFADIVKTPLNVPSHDFHLKTGFEIVGEMTTSKDNRQRYIFCNNDIITSRKQMEDKFKIS